MFSARTKIEYGKQQQSAPSVAQLEASIKALFADLDPVESLGVVYGLFQSLRPWFDETIAAHSWRQHQKTAQR
jgi:hypothetical protein